MDLQFLTEQALTLARAAGREIMTIYEGDFEVSLKADQSPLTEADMASHRLIVKGLKALSPQLPILSEEAANISWKERSQWHSFWLVDPIDGTRDFVNRSGEFTVNIALVQDGRPVAGVVTAPALGQEFWGIVGQGAWMCEGGQIRELKVQEPPREIRVLASKNHMNRETEQFIQSLGPHRLVQAGSSLKFCRIAQGEADLYPRRGPTCEWDTGAAQAVLEAAGGKVLTFDGEPLRYGKEDFHNPYFIAAGPGYGDHNHNH
ncbi:MAG: 3'(2'),5'-bisphosphate nucleotidase CysQ [Oleiphilaceae bacterium]|nr:3'(2'),5'-bisphosphate nucleotidase CysQ [Oleiphilaceae bacterium]